MTAITTAAISIGRRAGLPDIRFADLGEDMVTARFSPTPPAKSTLAALGRESRIGDDRAGSFASHDHVSDRPIRGGNKHLELWFTLPWTA
ncbi:hypothetical protein BRAS3843_2470039 [Bradyrhizobium sp. STM 3843]|nr:hypothetical protein BRAS3843_2470039 [Bradyrhizobium sp. STM 3843]